MSAAFKTISALLLALHKHWKRLTASNFAQAHPRIDASCQSVTTHKWVGPPTGTAACWCCVVQPRSRADVQRLPNHIPNADVKRAIWAHSAYRVPLYDMSSRHSEIRLSSNHTALIRTTPETEALNERTNILAARRLGWCTCLHCVDGLVVTSAAKWHWEKSPEFSRGS